MAFTKKHAEHHEGENRKARFLGLFWQVGAPLSTLVNVSGERSGELLTACELRVETPFVASVFVKYLSKVIFPTHICNEFDFF